MQQENTPCAVFPSAFDHRYYQLPIKGMLGQVRVPATRFPSPQS